MNRILGSITLRDNRTIKDKDWDDLIAGNSCVSSISECEIENPMTGEGVLMSSPPNLLAEVTVDDNQVGVLRVGMDRTEISIAGVEAKQLLTVLDHIAKTLDGTVDLDET